MIQPGTDEGVDELVSHLVKMDDMETERDAKVNALLRRFSTRDLAKACGVSHQTIARWGRAAG